MAFIESVEFLEISIATGETTDSASLTKSQTLAKCVPFMTMGPISGQTSEFDQIFFDIQMSSGPDRVVVTRTTSGGTATIGVTVVEFGTDATIQSGTFAMAAAAGSDTVSISSVTQSKAAFVTNYRCNGVGNTLWGPACVRGKFNASDELIFERDNTTGAIEGHYHLFECNNTEFSVQAIVHDIAASTTTKDTTITSVTMNKTFMISSFKTPGNNDDAENYTHSVKLTTATNIFSERGFAKDDVINAHVFVISFAGGGDQVVQRGTFNYGSGSTNETDTLTAVDLIYAMAWNANIQGCLQTGGDAAVDIETGWERVKVTSATEVAGFKDAGQVSVGEWEVIEWEKPDYLLQGKTYSNSGATLTDVNLILLKDNQDDTVDIIDFATSNGSGTYEFSGIADTDTQYQVYGYKDDSPHIFDVTDHVLEPKAIPDTSYVLYLRSDSNKGETSPDKDLRLRAQSDKMARRIFIIS